MMLQLWNGLTWPQALVLAFATAAFLAGTVPVVAECVTHLVETVLCILLAAVSTAAPAFQERMIQLQQWLRRQRLQLQKIHRRTKRRMREEAAT